MYRRRENSTHFLVTCATCGTPFDAGYSYKTRKYCNQKCRSLSQSNLDKLLWMARLPKNRRQTTGLIHNAQCGHCGAGFHVKPRRLATAKFCSRQCKWKAHRTTRNTCAVCGTTYQSNRKTCSAACRSVWQSKRQSGELSHLWQGGKTSEAMRVRNSPEYAAWRTAVFERDKYTCQSCGLVGGKLHADHIEPFSKAPERRLDVSNGRTLCVPCHRQTDTWGRGATHSHQPREHGRFARAQSA